MRLAGAAGAVFLADRLSKFVVLDVLDLGHFGRIEVFPPYLNFVIAWNKGINFGIGAGPSWFLVAVALAISAALAWWVLHRDALARDDPGKRRAVAYLAWGAGIVIGGALSNALDRIWYPEAAVFDFLNMSCCGIVNPYAFNVADVAIFAGAALIALKA